MMLQKSLALACWWVLLSPLYAFPTPTAATNIPLTTRQSALVSTLDAFFQTQPYTAAALTCGFKASTADYIAQKRQSRQVKKALSAEELASMERTRTDLKRNIAFLLYGALYQGMTQEFVYNHLYPVVFGAGNSLTEVLTKAAFDIVVQTTLVTLPIAYFTKAAIYRYSLKEAMRRYWHDICHQGLLIKYASLWFPVQCLNFAIVPEHYRVTFIAVVSFFWVIILSTLTSKTDAAKKEV